MFIVALVNMVLTGIDIKRLSLTLSFLMSSKQIEMNIGNFVFVVLIETIFVSNKNDELF